MSVTEINLIDLIIRKITISSNHWPLLQLSIQHRMGSVDEQSEHIET